MRYNSKTVNREIALIKEKNSTRQSISTSDKLKLTTVTLLVVSLLVLIILKS